MKATDLTLNNFSDVRTFGADTSYMRALTHRYVGGQLRFLTLTHTGILHEFAAPAIVGQKITATTAQWNIGQVCGDFTGLWWDEAKQRLWVTASIDYGSSSVYYPTRISTLTLGANGAVSNIKTVSLQGVTSKRAYGGVQPIPPSLQASLGGQYLIGWGGYTSLAQQTSRACMGPSLIAIPDIANFSGEIPSSQFRVLLDTPADQRGLRVTIPLNYFDSGDADPVTGKRRENPQTPPPYPPYSGAQWLSPNPQGLGWFTWGDCYYDNAAVIGDQLIMVAAVSGVTGQKTTTVGGQVVPGNGKAWYQGSTLKFDGRTQEVHVFNLASLAGPQTRPDSMAELALPRGIVGSWDGDVPMCNISGITFDANTQTLYLIGFPLGVPSTGPDGEWDTGRLYAMKRLDAPPPVNQDATVSPWSAWVATSAWSACLNNVQFRTEQRSRTIVTPATGSGTTPPLIESRTASQACIVTPPPPVTVLPVSGAILQQVSTAPAPSGYTKRVTVGALTFYEKD